MDERRRAHLAEEIRAVLSEVIVKRASDPRLQLITITKVKLSRDASHATVFYSTTGSEEDRTASTVAVKRAYGFLRKAIASGIRMRIVPELSFVHDNTVEEGDRVIDIINGLDDN